MDMASIVITGVSITPNPVTVGKSFIISADIINKVYVLGDDAGCLIDVDGKLLAEPERE